MPLYKIEHTMVGPYPKGRIVSKETFESQDGVEVQRLLDLGAISVVDDPKAKEDTSKLPLGPENNPGGGLGPTVGGKGGKAKGGEEVNDATVEVVDLKSMKKDELVDHAKSIGVEVNDDMTKQDIIDAIEAQQEDSSEEDE